MFRLSLIMAVMEGTYSAFLVSIVTYSILVNEFHLGLYSSATGRVFLLSASSVLISLHPGIPSLVVYGVVATIALNLTFTIFDAWTYASIEADPRFLEHRLDYIVIREIPLGAGRQSAPVRPECSGSAGAGNQ